MNQSLLLLEQGFKLSEAYYPDRIKEIGALRIRAWKSEVGISQSFFAQKEWIDRIDEDAHHWIITKNNMVVASARLSFHTSPEDAPYGNLLTKEHIRFFDVPLIASINRLVVDPKYRGKGFSKILDSVRIEYAIQKGANIIIAQPQLLRINTLKKSGFTLIDQLQYLPEMPGRPLFLMMLDLERG